MKLGFIGGEKGKERKGKGEWEWERAQSELGGRIEKDGNETSNEWGCCCCVHFSVTTYYTFFKGQGTRKRYWY